MNLFNAVRNLHVFAITFQNIIKGVSTVLLKCNVALARMYFPRISILDALLSTSTRTNSTRVEQGVEANVKDSIG